MQEVENHELEMRQKKEAQMNEVRVEKLETTFPSQYQIMQTKTQIDDIESSVVALVDKDSKQQDLMDQISLKLDALERQLKLDQTPKLEKLITQAGRDSLDIAATAIDPEENLNRANETGKSPKHEDSTIKKKTILDNIKEIQILLGNRSGLNLRVGKSVGNSQNKTGSNYLSNLADKLQKHSKLNNDTSLQVSVEEFAVKLKERLDQFNKKEGRNFDTKSSLNRNLATFLANFDKMINAEAAQLITSPKTSAGFSTVKKLSGEKAAVKE